MIPTRYIVERLGAYVLTIFAASLLIFLIPRFAPGDPITTLLVQLELQQGYSLGEEGVDVIARFKARFGLDKDLATQYFLWIYNVVQGNFGISIQRYPAQVGELVFRALPWTLGLLSSVTIISWVIGNIMGAVVGWHSAHKKTNWMFASVAIVVNKIPYYILGLLLVMSFTYYWPLFPSSGATDPLRIYNEISLTYVADVLYHAILPGLSVILVIIGGYVMTMRSLIVNIRGEDYLRFAEARGLKGRKIIMSYAFRNALMPQITQLALALGFMFSGALLIEWIFSYPGIGSLYIVAVTNQDYNVIQAVTLLIILGVATATLIIDLLSPLIDPRIGYGKR